MQKDKFIKAKELDRQIQITQSVLTELTDKPDMVLPKTLSQLDKELQNQLQQLTGDTIRKHLLKVIKGLEKEFNDL